MCVLRRGEEGNEAEEKEEGSRGVHLLVVVNVCTVPTAEASIVPSRFDYGRAFARCTAGEHYGRNGAALVAVSRQGSIRRQGDVGRDSFVCSKYALNSSSVSSSSLAPVSSSFISPRGFSTADALMSCRIPTVLGACEHSFVLPAAACILATRVSWLGAVQPAVFVSIVLMCSSSGTTIFHLLLPTYHVSSSSSR